MIRKLLFILCFCLLVPAFVRSEEGSSVKKVGLCIVATGKYIRFVPPLIESSEKYFLSGHQVSYFIFTDGEVPKSNKLIKVPHKQFGWPFDAMKRFDIYAESAALFKDLDYVYSIDADMLFQNEVGEEVFGDRVGTLCPGYVGKRGPFETKKISTAYVDKIKRRSSPYFAAGFFGGSREEFIRIVQQVKKQIHADLDKNFIAVWHDESHLNRYFVDNPPTVILSPSYCYPESQQIPFEKKLVALDKPDVKTLRK